MESRLMKEFVEISKYSRLNFSDVGETKQLLKI